MDILETVHSFWPDWDIEEILGRGAYGIVYKAKRTDFLGTSYAAVKKTTIPLDPGELEALSAEGMDPEQQHDYLENVVREFTGEIRMMEKVRGYTNIVSIEDYKILTHDGEPRWDIFIRMELLTPLNHRIAERPLTEAELIRLGIDLCGALTVCRRANIVHRDIKPENIFVNDDGVFKLGDFGVSRHLERHTFNMSRKGTYNYMAPEMFNGKLKDADIDEAARVDIYSLGMVLYRLANDGCLPFMPEAAMRVASDQKEALNRRMNGEPLPPPSNASEGLCRVILKACAFNPSDRYQSAEAMQRALEALANPTVDDDARKASATVRTSSSAKRELSIKDVFSDRSDDPAPVIDDDPDKTVAIRRTRSRVVEDRTMYIRPNLPEVEDARRHNFEEPRPERRFPLVRVIIIAAIVLALAAGGVTAWLLLRDGGDDADDDSAQDHGEPFEVLEGVPSAGEYTGAMLADASSYAEGDSGDPSCVADGSLSRAWMTDGSVENEWVELWFDGGQQYGVRGFRVCPGYWINSESFAAYPRPQNIRVSCGDTFIGVYKLEDARDCQTFYFDQPIATDSLRITFIDAYPGSQNSLAAVTELEVLGERCDIFTPDTLGDWGASVARLREHLEGGGTLTQGDGNIRVMGLQLLLRDAFHVLEGPVDGEFGEQTQEAVDKLADKMSRQLGKNAEEMTHDVDLAYWNNMLQYGEKLAK